MNFLNPGINLQQLAKEKKEEYRNAAPFPNIVLENFLNEDMLNRVLEEFPDLSKKAEVIHYANHNEKKLATLGEAVFGETTKLLAHFLNSEPILNFLQELTGIEEVLVPDPYFEGGGYHEIKPGGLLKIHADFNKNTLTKLDRRINLLVYLNKDWEEAYGGHFELWDKDMTTSCKKILPVFNRVAIFSTTDFSYHGHPNPLTCPPDRSRKSLALYYYSNGRPSSEINDGLEEHGTLFRGRPGVEEDIKEVVQRNILREFVPPIIFNGLKKVFKRS